MSLDNIVGRQCRIMLSKELQDEFQCSPTIVSEIRELSLGFVLIHDKWINMNQILYIEPRPDDF